ncbi:uncharacterized protein [Parasteatoda tepidariorum]|uniref:uncharacterized protein n=1 Tax=Parasteatoda tepidariorum TaxID=114398 RepID=UPI001C728C68|nr:uncharacterized protein LOC107453236 [Parasteatoda tepidariorum]
MVALLNVIVLYIVYLFFATSDGLEQTASGKKGSNETFVYSYFVDDNHDKLVVVQRRADNKITNCFILGDSALINEILDKIPKSDQYLEDKDKLMALITVCNDGQAKGVFTKGSVEDVINKFGLFSGLFFYPGTKWCGAGNISVDDDDLGSEIEADMCCRAHAHCNDTIPPFTEKYGLDNISPVTVPTCECDDLFRNCLREASTKASDQIGMMYFNVLPVKCFRQDYPIKSCKKYSGLARFICQKYDLDFNKDPTYQFFDHPHYDSSISDEDEDEDENHDVYSYLLHMEHEDMLYKLMKDSE